MTSIDWGNVIERAAWTALQAFLSAFGSAAVLTDWAALKSAALAGVIAAGAALISFVKTTIQERVSAA